MRLVAQYRSEAKATLQLATSAETCGMRAQRTAHIRQRCALVGSQNNSNSNGERERERERAHANTQCANALN